MKNEKALTFEKQRFGAFLVADHIIGQAYKNGMKICIRPLTGGR